MYYTSLGLDIGLFLLRLAIAVIFIYHAIPKLKNPKGMAAMMGKPQMGGMILLLGSVELVSSIFMIFGVSLQLAALALSIVMLGAIYMKRMKWGVPFFAMDKTGWEFDFILLAANLLLVLGGGGGIGVNF